MLLVFLLLSSGAASGQLVDSGRFLLYLNDREVGVEDFTIQRLGSGDAQRTYARGNVTMHDGRVFRTVLQMVGPEMAVAAYQVSLSGADTAVASFVRAGDRLRATVVEPEGERFREHRARPTTVVFDEGVAHHYFVLGLFTAAGDVGRTLHTFAPLSEEPEDTVELRVGPHALDIGGAMVETTRVRLGADDEAGAAWFDGSGRLIRVALPLHGFAAERVR